MRQESDQIVAHLFRTEYGKLVSVLTKFLGIHRLQMAEDVVQETLLAAIEHWAKEGVPSVPTAWLLQVAKRKALNQVKRERFIAPEGQETEVIIADEPQGTIYLEGEVVDSQLRMIFTCCDPKLTKESQIALTLKTLCGFGVKEVARALLTSESTINKRLYRAKNTLRETRTAFQIPTGQALDHRLDAVMITLYLLFNEGYNSSTGSLAIKKDLCLEAMQLMQLLLQHYETNKKLFALMALMCFHTARFEARIGTAEAIVLFQDQDRSKWNKALIAKGIAYLQKASESMELSAYHIEACIAAEHCMATSFETTQWKELYQYYELLWAVQPNPIIKLNLAIVQSKIKGYAASLDALKLLEQDAALKYYHLLPATQGIFLLKMDRRTEALTYLKKALTLKPSISEQAYIQQRIKECEGPPTK